MCFTIDSDRRRIPTVETFILYWTLKDTFGKVTVESAEFSWTWLDFINYFAVQLRQPSILEIEVPRIPERKLHYD